MKTVIQVGTAMLGALLLTLAIRWWIVPADALAPSRDSLAAFLNVVGLSFSLVTAFVIFVVWTQFHQVSELVDREANSLEDLYRYFFNLEDADLSHRLIGLLKDYVDNAAGREWEALAAGQMCAATQDRFERLVQSVRDISVTDERAKIVLGQCLRHVGQVSNLRYERLSAGRKRIPKTLWGLLWFISSSLVVLLYLLHIPSDVVAAVSIMAVIGIVACFMSVIADLDNPFDGVWNVSPKPFTDLQARLWHR